MPAYWRMVHSRPRYMVGCTPRVNGGSPGKPTSRSWFHCSSSAGVYSGLTSRCDEVSAASGAAGLAFSFMRTDNYNAARRSGSLALTRAPERLQREPAKHRGEDGCDRELPRRPFTPLADERGHAKREEDEEEDAGDLVEHLAQA